MKKVRIKGPAIKLNGVWQFKNTVVDISDEEYVENKDYLDLIEKIEEVKSPLFGEADNGETNNDSVSSENVNDGKIED